MDRENVRFAAEEPLRTGREKLIWELKCAETGYHPLLDEAIQTLEADAKELDALRELAERAANALSESADFVSTETRQSMKKIVADIRATLKGGE